jgi:hypothetical protein
VLTAHPYLKGEHLQDIVGKKGYPLGKEIMEKATEGKIQAEQQRELAKYRYDRGVTDNFDLVQAEEQLTEARAAHLLAVIDRAVAAAAVRRTAGTLTRAFVDLPDEIAPSPDALEPLDRRPGAERPDRCASGTPGKCDTED